MDDITERILNCLLELGIVFEQEENNFELTDYIEDSLTFISFVSELENEFDIEIPDEYLLQGVLGTPK
ncbi:phosphopantetheine-binding protein [Gallintestinimicrobium sp.]|uniref:phosphopantetheine-binding protein n=1 Tax=Gallintestinimicrobium sp. TaxID=2981655 RepID=UPI0039998DB5